MADNKSEWSREVIDTGEEGGWSTKEYGNKMTLKVDVDCSDAIVGLKAIQREAKAATRALKELEEAQERVVIDE